MLILQEDRHSSAHLLSVFLILTRVSFSHYESKTLTFLGGQLRLTHKGHSTLFDWSNTEDKHIQWAAFYSDCEHEVLEVKAGNRITLTYNLYVTEQVGGVLRRNPTVDPSLFPLYE